MSAVGFSTFAISPSMLGITKELEEQLVAPIEKAAQQAGSIIEKSMGNSAQIAAKNMESAQFRVKKATQEQAKAEEDLKLAKSRVKQATEAVESAEIKRSRATSKASDTVKKAEENYSKALNDSKSTAADVEAAERKLNDARLAEQATVIDQENAVQRARDRVTRETRKQIDQEQKLESALTESARASEKLSDRQEELEKSTEDAGKESKSFRDRLREMGDELDKNVEKTDTFSDKIKAGFGKIGTGALLGVGAKIGTGVMDGIGTAFDKGFSRLASIEQAETMLGGLGHDAAGVQEIMDNALESVSGTAFGFGEAASMAATFAGAGIEQGTELTNILKLVGDTAAITGSDFNEMGSIWTKVATGQKLQTAEMNQLMDRGLGVLPELQKHYGVTADEARKMVTEGKVGFEDFSEIMENMVGGSASAMGETFSGSAANMQAALGRLGANLMDPIYANMPDIFSAIGGAVDKVSEHLSPLIEDWSEKLQPYIEDFASNLGPWLEQAIDDIAAGIKNLVDWGKQAIDWLKENETWVKSSVAALGAFAAVIGTVAAAMNVWSTAKTIFGKVTKIATGEMKLFNLAMKTNVIIAVVAALAAVVAGLVYFFTQTETGQELWARFTGFLKDSWDSVSEKFGSVIDWITEKWESFTGWISTAWEGITSLFQGDFTSALSDAFGVEEDNPLISGFLKVHEILTGIPELVKGITDILFRGDFTGLPFGLEEDSGIVKFLFGLRDAVIKTGEIFKAVWDGIVTVGKWAFVIIGTVVLTPLMLLWNYLSSSIKDGWEKIIKPTWDALSSFASWMWESVLSPVFTWIGDAWSALGDKFSEIWEVIKAEVLDPLVEKLNEIRDWWTGVMEVMSEVWQGFKDRLTEIYESIRTAVFDAFMWYIGRVQANWELVTSALGAAWEWFKNILSIAWEWIKAEVFDVFNFYMGLLQSGFDLATAAMGSAWNWLKDVFGSAWGWIRDNVFSKFEGAVDVIKSSFEVAVDAIGKAWASLKALLATPVNFVIETIYMGGVREAWSAVAGLVDLPDLPKVEKIGGFARGGILPGFSRMVDGDDQLVPMRRGEGVLVSEGLQDQTSRQLFLAANEEAKQGKSFSEFMSDYVAGYANGGIVGSLNSIMKEFYPELQMTSHFRPGDSGYHGKNMAADFSNTGSGMPSTPAMQAASAFMFGNYGDQLEQLIHHPARNIGSGMDVGDGFGYYGAGTMYGHTDHIHLAALKALVDPSGVVQMVPYDGEGGGGFSLGSMVKSLWDSIIGKISTFTDGAGLVAELPGAFLGKISGAAWEFISSRIGNFFGASGSTGDAESWRDMAEQAMRRNGFNTDDPAQINAMLSQIMSESGGNPGIAQQIVDINGTGEAAGVGLLQIIPGTFAAHRDPELPDDRRDPWANMNAALRYYKSRYGTDLTSMWGHGHGYADGGIITPTSLGLFDQGGWLPNNGLAINRSGTPEPVFNASQWADIKALIDSIGDLHPELRRMVDELTPQLKATVNQLSKMADSSSIEGITARSVTSRVIGMDVIPHTAIIEKLMTAETSLLDARAGHVERLQGIVDKEKALSDAQEELDKLLSDDSGMSTQSARKLEDAQKALAKAQEDAAKSANAEYKDAEKRADAQAKSADKVADAEEKLSRVREDIADSAESDAEKRADDVTKATAAVSKAEQDLVSARAESVKQLDHIMLPETVGGLIPQLGQASAAIGSALPQVSGALSGLAATALPAGMSLGVVLTLVESTIDIIRQVWDGIAEIVDQINAMRVFEAEGWAQTFASMHEWTGLLESQRQAVGALQQQMINDQLRLTEASWSLRTAQFDQQRAQLEGVKNVAQAQAALDAERERAGQQAIWDTEDLSGAFDRYRWAQKIGWQELLGDAVAITPEILALQAELNSVKLLAEASELEAAKNTLGAIHQMTLASINLGRTVQKLEDQQMLLDQMEGTNLGLTGEESLVMSELAEIMADNARLNADRNSLENRGKDALGTAASFLTFGLVGNTWKETQDSFDEAIRANNARMDRIMDQYEDLVSPEDFEEMKDAMKRASDQFAAGNTAGAEAILRGEILGRADIAIKDAQLDREVIDWKQELTDARNAIEDTELEWDYQNQLQPILEEIFAKQSEAAGYQYRADAIREENPAIREAYEALADREMAIADSVREKRPINITLTGDAVSTERVREILEEIGANTDELDIRVSQLEEPEEDDLLDAINSRRRY